MLKPMIDKGLAAAIYTQITDVEIEVNGLVIYDRDIIRMEREGIRKANRWLDENGH
ncbi:MAG: hypothetical protein ACR2NU_14035 [Aeoliella sp.]